MFVEGLRTEERYLLDWHRRHRGNVIVTIDPFRGGPLQLVQHAVERRRVETSEERRGRGRAHDETWCVFDIDEHPNVRQAVALAQAQEIHLAISNPCLELWLILHFEDRTAWIDRRQAQNRSEGLLHCSKVLTDEALQLLFTKYGDAAHRAQDLDGKHQADGSPPGENPSSGVWRLVESICTPGGAVATRHGAGQEPPTD